MYKHLPQKQGLYNPAFEHDSCGVGFVCDVKGKRSHEIVAKGIEVLERMSHRGAVGADTNTGDGAGILMQIPHKFYEEICREKGIDLPGEGDYGTGLVFMPVSADDRRICEDIFLKIIAEENQIFLGWRDVPVNDSTIGKGALKTQPAITQIFIARGESAKDRMAFERKLYVIRKRVGRSIASSGMSKTDVFYITNISSRTVSYKGLLRPGQLREYYPDLDDARMESSLALVHSRYSTNTFPTWDLAQPFRFIAHNGEINTLRGNINWMRARERMMVSKLFGNDIDKLKPVIREGGSDSATIDNVFELLALSGRSLAHSAMMLIPSAWEHDKIMEQGLKDFYEFHACLMEPWDGPAAIAFTDGASIGAVLDRNGLRPARYIITKKNIIVMASEAGVVDIDPAEIKFSGRIEPGKMFFVDTALGRVIGDDEVKKEIAGAYPYGKWNRDNIVELDKLVGENKTSKVSDNILAQLKAFGYSREDLKMIIKPMAKDAKEPVGSMGNDTPHAVLSEKPQVLYNYFKQLFAQVTNPAIDPIREKLVMSLESYIGPDRNILEAEAGHAQKLKITSPILTDADLAKIRGITINKFKTKTVLTFFSRAEGVEGFKRALERICYEAEYAIGRGYSFVILSDNGSSEDDIALPALLALSAVHQHLVNKTIRSEVGLIVESAEPREVHHFALLFGYGADSINPYLAYSCIDHLIKEGELDLDHDTAQKNYIKAVENGILKILSKIGISTLRSYRGSQIFEALGLNSEFINKYFTGTVSRVGGSGIDEIARETLIKHEEAYPKNGRGTSLLGSGGVYQWKKDGEFHLWNPESIAAIQDSTRENDYEKYKNFARLINDQRGHPTTLRSLLKFKKANPVPVEEVEPAENIMKRFVTGAMSFGSISRSAHETIAIAMNRIGGKSNTGEGGEDPARFIPLPNGDSKRSAIKQVASGRFGVTANYLVNADEIQIKIAQGAKPGEGGQLPGHKVSAVIAKTRHTSPGVTLISPPPHHDIYSIEDLAQLIFDLKNTNPKARISVKLVSEVGVGTVAAGVAKGHADMILISGGDGGTGASPRSSLRHAGLPWELGLSETHQTLVLNDLRSRVRLQTDGQLRTGRDVAIAALLGAEEYGFCTAVLIVCGCVMLRHCHLNNCSVGVATQDDILQKKFRGRPEHIVNYFTFIVRELRKIMADLGLRTIDEMIGRTDLLEADEDSIPEKSNGMDFSKILFKPDTSSTSGHYYTGRNKTQLNNVLDREIIKFCEPVFQKNRPVKGSLDISNSDRATGAMLSGEVCKRCGDEVLLEDTIMCKFRGVAGQSFGAFLAKGITFELEGMANDYVGKGISGGKIIIYPDKRSDYNPEENILIGNTAFYGAISGEAYLYGLAGERFCVRNSGLYAVVEGVGDHGCEYMTGGRVIVLGKTGRNFAAGMSGGIAYVYDDDGDFKSRCNLDMVCLDRVKEEDRDTIYNLLHNHMNYTGSSKAKQILHNLREEMKRFVRVIPIEYKRILEAGVVEKEININEESDG